MNLKLIIFDMDGLLLDTERIANAAWIKAGRNLNISITSNILRKIKGGDTKNTLEIIKKFLDEQQAEELISRKKIIEAKIIQKEEIKLKKGVVKLLNFLEKTNFKKIVATSTERTIAERELKNLKIYDYFDDFIFGDEVENGKPNPEIFLKACKKVNISVENTIVLEDSVLGLKAAVAGNIKCVVIEDTIKLTNDENQLVYKKFVDLLKVKIFLKKYLRLNK